MNVKQYSGEPIVRFTVILRSINFKLPPLGNGLLLKKIGCWEAEMSGVVEKFDRFVRYCLVTFRRTLVQVWTTKNIQTYGSVLSGVACDNPGIPYALVFYPSFSTMDTYSRPACLEGGHGWHASISNPRGETVGKIRKKAVANFLNKNA